METVDKLLTLPIDLDFVEYRLNEMGNSSRARLIYTMQCSAGSQEPAKILQTAQRRKVNSRLVEILNHCDAVGRKANELAILEARQITEVQ